MESGFSEYKKIFKHSAVYGFGNLSSKIVGFVLLPVYMRFLLPSDYGVLELITVTSSILIVILNLGMNSAIFRSYFNYDEKEKKQEVISTAFFFCLLEAGVVFAILLTQSSAISNLLFGTDGFTTHIRLMIVTVFFSTAMLVPLAVLRAEERSFRYISLTVSQVVLMLVLNIYFVVVMKLGVLGVLIGTAIAGALVYIAGLASLIGKLKKTFSWNELKAMLTFGIPLVPAALANRVLTSADRYLLKYLAGLDEVGLYSLGYRISSIMLVFVVQPFMLAWPVVMFRVAREEGAKEIYRNVLTYYVLVALWIALALSVFSREIITIIAPPVYHSAYRVVPLLVLSAFFAGAFYVVSVGLNIERKTGYFPLIIGSAALVNIGANYLLIPAFGMIGAAVATAFAQLIVVIATWGISRKYYMVKYDSKRILHTAIVALFIFAVSRLFAMVELGVVYYAIVDAVLVLLYPVFLYITGFFNEEEKLAINGYLKRLKGKLKIR